MLASRAKTSNYNIKIRARRYKSSAKEKRKQRKRESMGYGATQEESEVPAFFLPSRYKLLAKVLNDHKNTNRITRKPLPEDIKKSLAKQAKEYNEFKVAEKILIDREYNTQLNH